MSLCVYVVPFITSLFRINQASVRRSLGRGTGFSGFLRFLLEIVPEHSMALSLKLLDDLYTHPRSLKFVNAATIGLGLTSARSCQI